MIRKDYVHGTNFIIYQDPNRFAFGTDSIMLLAFSKAKGIVVDLGCGTGIFSLGLVARKEVKKVYSVDLQKEVLELLEKSIDENNLEGQVIPRHESIEDFAKSYPEKPNSIIMNPPYFENDIVNSKENYRISRHNTNIDTWIKVASKLLPTKGSLELVYRPDRLASLIEAMKKYRIEPKILQFVRTNKHSDAKLVFVRGLKESGVELKVLPDIISHEEDGSRRDWTLDFSRV